MKIKEDFIYLNEEYILEENDIFKVERKKYGTLISINDKEIELIDSIEYIQKGPEETRIKIKRFFTKDDFKKIKPYYREEKN